MFEQFLIMAAAQLWGHIWTGRTVAFTTDNQATADIISKGKSKLCPSYAGPYNYPHSTS